MCVVQVLQVWFAWHLRKECKILHGPWQHTGEVSPDSTPILTKAWHKNEPNTVPWYLQKIRAGFWICCDAVVNEDDSSCWDRVEVIASLGGDQLPSPQLFIAEQDAGFGDMVQRL